MLVRCQQIAFAPRGWVISISILPRNETHSKVLTLVEHLNRRQRLFVTYATEDGTSTQRTIRPLGLWFWGKVWTLVAWCELRDDFRMFRVDRMSDPDLLDTFRHEPGKRLADFYARQKHP